MPTTCSHCRAEFEIAAADLALYEKVSPVIGARKFSLPPPRLCPPCRSELRCMHRNERSLYRRSCDLCHKDTVAMYSKDAPFPVYCPACFYGDGWNPLDFGRDYDPDRPFFDQLSELYAVTPRLSIMNKQSENSDYCNYSYANKNCYLTSGSHYEEDCLYGAYSTKNKDCLDSLWMYGSELAYECMFSKNCYHSAFLDHCDDCRDCYFSRDLKGCSHCLFSANLRQKKFCIFNEQKSEEEYFRILASLNLDTFSGVKAAQEVRRTELPKRFPVRALYAEQCENCEGDTLSNCKNMRQYFYASNCEDCAYGAQADGTYDSMDIDYMGYDRSELCYQAIGCLGLFSSVSCNACWNGSGLRYCQYCFSCTDCLGCISLQQQEHCILNRTYSKEDYEKLATKILSQMTANGELGGFFPASLSPFGYNESMAQDWNTLEKKEVLKRGYRWKEDEGTPGVEKIIDAEALPENIDAIPDDVLNWAIRCTATKRPFRITKKELTFYRSMKLPLPHIHPDERHRQRKALRNPRSLWSRECAKCHKGIQTTYAPDRPEIVYCERCYLETVY